MRAIEALEDTFQTFSQQFSHWLRLLLFGDMP